MQERFRHIWRKYEAGLPVSPRELINYFIESFDISRVQDEIDSLPAGYLHVVKEFVESHQPYRPTGFILGKLTPQQREDLRMDRKHRFEVLAGKFDVEVIWSDQTGEFIKRPSSTGIDIAQTPIGD